MLLLVISMTTSANTIANVARHCTATAVLVYATATLYGRLTLA
jgi:hypothetical protein